MIPEALKEARKIFNERIQFSDDHYEILRGADALAVVTDWNEFRTPDFEKIKKLLKKPVIFDGRNIYNKAELRKTGFTYYSIGRRYRQHGRRGKERERICMRVSQHRKGK